MSKHKLKCPICKYKFTIDGDYDKKDCPNCEKTYYFWDDVIDDVYGKTYGGYFWEIKNK